MADVLSLVRPHIRRFQAYSSARSEFAGNASVWLDANENPFGSGLNRYPDPVHSSLSVLVAQRKGVQPDELCIGNGSDELIDLLIRIFCEPQRDAVLVVQPSYGMYEVCAAVNNVEVRSVLAEADFSVSVESLLSAAFPPVKMLFLCSPNNPTGRSMAAEDIALVARSFGGVVVVDEAYIDFAPQQSALSLLSECANVVVLQTLSKAVGLAGARVGMAFAHRDIIAVLRAVKPPYNVSVLNQQAALDALQRDGEIHEQVRLLCSERERLRSRLSALPIVREVVPSDANFLLVRVVDAAAMYRFLCGRGVVVRNRSSLPLCQNCLRITVGTPAENDALLALLEDTFYQKMLAP